MARTNLQHMISRNHPEANYILYILYYIILYYITLYYIIYYIILYYIILIYIYWVEVESLGVTYKNLLWFISKRIYLSFMSYPTDSGQRSTTHTCSAYINKMRIPHGPLEYYDD